ncbi:MAG: hypothetical protein GY711_08375 [bacterium]|nr:hypothetical protein [bacterium]
MRSRAIARSRRRGVALVYALFGAFVAVSMVTVMFTMAGVTNTRSSTERGRIQARYVAEGAVEAAKRQVQGAIANWTEPPATGEISIGDGTATYTIEATGQEAISTAASGIQTILTTFEIEATATVGRYTAQSHRLVQAMSTPIFQYAVFYTNDLEILPGPSMTLGGRVHSNGDMYIGCGGTLTVDTNYMHAVGDMYRRRKNNDAPTGGTVRIRRWVDNPYDPTEPSVFVNMNSRNQMTAAGVGGTTSGYDSDFDGYDPGGDGGFYDPGDWLPWAPGALEFWSEPASYGGGTGQTVQTSEHGIEAVATPSVGSIQMFEEADNGSFVYNSATGVYDEVGAGLGTHDRGYYHENADLAITVFEDGTWEAWDRNMDRDVTSALTGIVTITTVFDARQGGDVAVAKIDMDALNGSGAFPANGLLYASHYGLDEGTSAAGVQLYNGEELADALTVVTEGSVYVQGDYNVTDKQGCAVIGDAVNLLSNAWDGSKTPGNLPAASDTTFNAAIVTGNYVTESGRYNGGLENLPRFHESWSGVDCVIRGAFVNAWESAHATGDWVYGGDRYRAPRRLWAYDTDFNSVGNLPPFTPMAVSARDIVSW